MVFFDRHRRIGLIAVVLLCSCSRQDGNDSQQPVILFDELTSYSTSREVLDALEQRGLAVEHAESSHLPSGDSRPEFSIDVYSVSDYSQMGLHGAMRLSFFNDRLMSVRFYPQKPQEFLAKLESQAGMDLRKEPTLEPKPNLLVRLGRDFRGSLYVAFEDKHLIDEHDAWLREYT